MSLLADLTVQKLLNRLVAFFVVVTVHGLALAALARLLGDSTPRHAGRLTANPVAHTATPALVMGLLFQLFWTPPMRIRTENLRWGRTGLVLVAFGAFAITLVSVPSLQWLRSSFVVQLPRTTGLALDLILAEVQQLSLWFVALNWLPLPLLTGAYFFYAAVPKAEGVYKRHSAAFGAFLMFSIVAGWIELGIGPVHTWLAARLIG